MQQRDTENKYLKDDLHKKEEVIRSYEEQLRLAGSKMDEIRDAASEQLSTENGHARELSLEIDNLKVKLLAKERELEKE